MEERINDWDPNLEARPPLMEIIEATKNERVADRHGILQFSETESDEPGNGWIVRCLSRYGYDLSCMISYVCKYSLFNMIIV